MHQRSFFLSALSAFAIAATLTFAFPQAEAATAKRPAPARTHVTHHRTAVVDGVKIFYREAGPADAPVVVLLHGFPTSSHMFRNLIPALADRYRVIAPDYPGFGHSAMPDRKDFAYTLREVRRPDRRPARRSSAPRATRSTCMDYGAPVGYRLALKHPERVTALVVQNGNAYDEGLREFWKPIKAYWADGSHRNRDALRAGLDAGGDASSSTSTACATSSRIDPDSWVHDQALLDRPGNRRDPARPVQGLRHQRRALPAVPGVLPRRASRRR